MIRLLTVLLVFLPATAFACAFGFSASTYPIEYTVWGLVAASFLGILFGDKLKGRKAFWRSIVLSCVIGSFGLGLFIATSPSHFGFGGFAVWTILLMPLLMQEFRSRRARIFTFLTIGLFSLFVSWLLASSQQQAERVGKFQQLNDSQRYENVRF